MWSWCCWAIFWNISSRQKAFKMILSHLFHFHPQKISPWVGLRKINISYWGWDDMSPFTNTTLQWLPGEPNDSGFCAYLERAEVAGLKANPCTAMADGLVCEKPVGKENLTPRNWCCGEWQALWGFIYLRGTWGQFGLNNYKYIYIYLVFWK